MTQPDPASVDHLEHLYTRIIHIVGLGVRMERRMSEMADVLLKITQYVSGEHLIAVGEAGTKVASLVQELREFGLVLNDDFKEIVTNEAEMNKKYLMLVIENEGLKYRLEQLEKETRK